MSLTVLAVACRQYPTGVLDNKNDDMHVFNRLAVAWHRVRFGWESHACDQNRAT
jgi:hypothetical protein